MSKPRPVLPNAPEIARRREEKGWTQERLAERAGCSLRTVQRVERGTPVRAGILDELSGALECYPDDISLQPSDAARTPNAGRWAALFLALGAAAAITGSLYLLDRGPPKSRVVGVPLIGDVDDDGQDDLVLWEPASGRWRAVRTDGVDAFGDHTPVLGLDGDVPFTAKLSDPTGHDLAIWRPALGKWYAVRSTREPLFPLDGEPSSGAAGDVPLVGDVDGDGLDDLVTWRPHGALWSAVSPGGTPVLSEEQWGRDGDLPLLGDFDGDGRADLAIWRPSTGHWFARDVEGKVLFRRLKWGAPGDLPLLGDFDGDGRADLTSYRPSTGEWSARSAPSRESGGDGNGGSLFHGVVFGNPGDQPRTGDFNGDGRDELCVWRAAEGEWLAVETDGSRLFRIDVSRN